MAHRLKLNVRFGQNVEFEYRFQSDDPSSIFGARGMSWLTNHRRADLGISEQKMSI
jgi:hypothetical protein